MPIVMLKFKVNNWNVWKKLFLANKHERKKSNVKTLYFGHEKEDPNSCHVSLDVTSLDEFNEYIKKNKDPVRRAGVIPGTMRITVLDN